ncbi:ExbD/TolR family protein [Telmatospirillum siberiense]|uniref:Biopolymer transporter ExbD n=1 Tax=Telmatospirillum siberiense TaxID=382514 RepID=A0A2N3PQ33_9PROT|nr:biopolymer transporter ExbD [Telmatospirillum siberiense]PKU22513.1 biopolymer transporter ExbD [Telmatospirillum siberiense]
MALNLPSAGETGEPEVMMEINTTPLIDVMLVLLIMLIITIPIQTHAVKLDMPVGTPPAASTPPQVVTVDVDFDGTILWNGQVIPNREALDDHLRAVVAAPDQPELHLRPNKLATYKFVAAVLASAQRLGVTKIGVVGNEQFIE